MLNLTISFIVSLLVTMLIVRVANRDGATADHDLDGIQKFHVRPVPRIGGLSIVAGCTVAVAALTSRDLPLAIDLGLLLLCSAVVFGIGLAEDLTKRIRPLVRLLCAFAGAVLAALLLQATVTRVDIPLIDAWLAIPLVGGLAAVVCVGAMVNAVNIIDGFNGLAAAAALAMFASLGYVAFKVSDPLILGGSLLMIGAILGFLVWNYPYGLIFLGDGGAYFLGFMLAELGILLVVRNPVVSAWYPALLFIYPIFETLFSIYRKKYLRGMSPSMPDGVHLHMLIYKRVIRWAIGTRNARLLTQRNAVTSPYLWALSLVAIVPATVFWDRGVVLMLFLATFIAVYTWLYTAIVRFRTPRWLVLHRAKE
ncbi:glycosyltransferase [Pigmentiphaga sp.]|uniref:MraY family glycosyltransferase n=1 Tax=Pigmentiphaga sp. TaxID=1977564 RepID=UPI00128D41DC|nr:glycosyltransferase [Pigmentiphaga sp.]MPS27830.1 glycosyl transferase [Alcaligenaceae bacterium SAGV5]MPS50991.1 glycosyl transferase [Alcaligenaceae bacterium SAGV3]MPT55808.1 glycosyl transferase [Alcaligenaceae bacterium]